MVCVGGDGVCDGLMIFYNVLPTCRFLQACSLANLMQFDTKQVCTCTLLN